MSTFSLQPDPPPSVAHWDIGVPVSTDDVSMQGDIIPIDSTAGTGDAVAPRSSRLSWKSETEDRGKLLSMFMFAVAR